MQQHTQQNVGIPVSHPLLRQDQGQQLVCGLPDSLCFLYKECSHTQTLGENGRIQAPALLFINCVPLGKVFKLLCKLQMIIVTISKGYNKNTEFTYVKHLEQKLPPTQKVLCKGWQLIIILLYYYTMCCIFFFFLRKSYNI